MPKLTTPRTLALLLAPGLLLGAAAPGGAGLVPGGGNQRSDCYIEMDVEGVTVPSSVVRNNKIVDCTDGDACDQGPCGDDRCDFTVQPCILQTDPNLPLCTPPASLDRARVKNRFNVAIPQLLQGPQCGPVVDVPVAVKVKRNGNKKPGQVKYTMIAKAPAGTSPRKETDKDAKLRCLPRTAACAPSTTTTTTLPPVCGNGLLEPGEGCDPPCGAGCGAGQLCDGTCQCVTQQACNCGSPEPTKLMFSTVAGGGFCGGVIDQDGALAFQLACGGLYFGGGACAVPLPAPVPDMGTSIVKACCSGTTLNFTGASPAETGSNRNCSTRDCLFGAPLPIPNANSRPISTCVLNYVARDAVGSGQCDLGTSTIDVPLRSEVFLFGDLLNNDDVPDRPDVPGIQPCPLCTTTCNIGSNAGKPCTSDTDCPGGGTCGTQTVCIGGPNHTLPCTPGTSKVGVCTTGVNAQLPCDADADCPGGICDTASYPTSHDCPPPMTAGQPIGRLPIAFKLTTGTVSKTAVDLNGPEISNSADRTFCGFCRDTDFSYNFGVCLGGDNNGVPCAQQNECTGGGTCGGAKPCTTSADCSQPLEACEQRDNGAFSLPAAQTLTLTGSPGGDMRDGMPHPATIVGLFCVPPVFDPSIDAAADLPGPGSTALPGMAQLLP